MPSVSSKREARSAEAFVMEMPLKPAAAGRHWSRNEKLSIHLSAMVMSRGQRAHDQNTNEQRQIPAGISFYVVKVKSFIRREMWCSLLSLRVYYFEFN